MEIRYDDSRKDLPSEQLRGLFQLVGWSDGTETPEQKEQFSVGFQNSTLVVSAWDGERLVGAVRVLSDRMFRSVLYDLAVDPSYQDRGIGRELVRRCIGHFPNSEWLVQTTPQVAGYYETCGFQRVSDCFLAIPCKLFSGR